MENIYINESQFTGINVKHKIKLKNLVVEVRKSKITTETQVYIVPLTKLDLIANQFAFLNIDAII